MPCLRHRSLADIPAACSFSTLMICSSVNLPLRIVRLLGGEQNPNSKPGAFQGSRSAARQQKVELLSDATRLGETPSGQRLFVIRAVDDETHLVMALGTILTYIF